MNKQYEENRFAYLKGITREELESLQKETSENIEYALEQTEDKKISSEQKSEAFEDLKYGRDLLVATEKELESRNSKKL